MARLGSYVFSLGKHGLWDDPASASEGPIYERFTKVVSPYGFKTEHAATYLAWRFGYLVVSLFFNILFLMLQVYSNPMKCSINAKAPLEFVKNSTGQDEQIFPVREEWFANFEEVCRTHGVIAFICQVLVCALLFASLALARPGILKIGGSRDALLCRGNSRLLLFSSLAFMVLPQFCLYYSIVYFKQVNWKAMDRDICSAYSNYVFTSDEAMQRGVVVAQQGIKYLQQGIKDLANQLAGLDLTKLESELQKKLAGNYSGNYSLADVKTAAETQGMPLDNSQAQAALGALQSMSDSEQGFTLSKVKAKAESQGIKLDDAQAQSALAALQTAADNKFFEKAIPIPQAGPSYRYMLTFVVKKNFVDAENINLLNGAFNKWCTDLSDRWSHKFNYNTRCLWALKEEWVIEQKNTAGDYKADNVKMAQFLDKFAAASGGADKVCDSVQDKAHQFPQPLNQADWWNPAKVQQNQLEFLNFFYFKAIVQGTILAGKTLGVTKVMYRGLCTVNAAMTLFPICLGVLGCLPEALLNLKGVFPGSRSPGNILAFTTAMNVFVFAVVCGAARQAIGGGISFLLLMLLFLAYKAFSVLTGKMIGQYTNSKDDRENFYCLNLKLEIGLRNVIVLVMILIFGVAAKIEKADWQYKALEFISSFVLTLGEFLISYMASKSIFAICLTDYLCRAHVLDKAWFKHKLDKEERVYYENTADDLYKLLHVKNQGTIKELRDKSGQDLDLPDAFTSSDEEESDEEEVSESLKSGGMLLSP